MEQQHQPITPVKLKTANNTWAALPAHTRILEKVKPLQQWLQGQKGATGSKRVPLPATGYPVLFEGADHDSKKLTAGLLAKEAGREVYRVDLSKLVSKYIGETEKNLDRLFEKAASENWVLFFDEADALLGKRTTVNDAHDRYANQVVAYLLQRIGEHTGLVIVAAKSKAHIDPAFMRRFQAIIKFPLK